MVTEWRTKYRRETNLLDNVRNSKAVDSLINFETVKYYGNADFEVQTFDETILNYQVLLPSLFISCTSWGSDMTRILNNKCDTLLNLIYFK